MSYVIKDSQNRYFTTHSGELTTNINMAKQWDNIYKAKNVLSHAPAKLRKLDFKVEHIINDKDNFPIALDNLEEIPFDINEEIVKINNMNDRLNKRTSFLSLKISDCDLKISDLLHIAEFYKLNAYEGFDIYRQIHNVRIQRRKYKDELFQINLYLSSITSPDKIEILKNRIQAQSERKYSPRYYTDYLRKNQQ